MRMLEPAKIEILKGWVAPHQDEVIPCQLVFPYPVFFNDPDPQSHVARLNGGSLTCRTAADT